MEAALRPRVVQRDEAPEYRFFGRRTWFKATGEETGGDYGLLEHLIAPGDASTWHVHHAEDETFYVVAGRLTVGVGEERFAVGPGGYAFGPRGIPHGFRNDAATPARVLLMATPAGFERFVRALAVPVEPGVPDPVSPDMGQLMAVAAEYQIEILGPFPERPAPPQDATSSPSTRSSSRQSGVLKPVPGTGFINPVT
jgi:mannose-6-phosphate isomerase-like protein (cupin superfamily)